LGKPRDLLAGLFFFTVHDDTRLLFTVAQGDVMDFNFVRKLKRIFNFAIVIPEAYKPLMRFLRCIAHYNPFLLFFVF